MSWFVNTAIQSKKILRKVLNLVTYENGQLTDPDGATISSSGSTPDGSITTAKLADDAVTTIKILDGNVTTPKIANDAVTTVKILDGNVTTNKLANDAVTTVKILDGNVTTNKLADNAVTSTKISNNAITTTKILDANVTTAKLADVSVTSAKLAATVITELKSTGDPYQFDTGVADTNPGAGKFRFNSATLGSITKLWANDTDYLGTSFVSRAMSAAVNDLFTYVSLTNPGTVLATFKVTAATTNKTGYREIGVSYVTGALPANNEIVDLRHIPVSSVITTGGGGGTVAAFPFGTYAQMIPTQGAPAAWNRGYYRATDYGVRGGGVLYRSNGSEAVADGIQPLYDNHPVLKIMTTNTRTATATASATVSPNAGKTLVTLAGHQMVITSANILGELPLLRIDSWSGSGTPGLYSLLNIDDTDTFTIDVAYSAGNGVPTFASKYYPINTGIVAQIPPLNNFSEIRGKVLLEFSEGIDTKNLIVELAGTRIALIEQDFNEQITCFKKFGFRNCGAKNIQEPLFEEEFASISAPQSTELIQKMAIDTSVATTMTFKFLLKNANEYVNIRHLELSLKN